MLRHVNNVFSDAQAVTATAVSTNVIDLGSPDVGEGNPVDVNVEVGTAFSGLTSVQVAFQDSADNSSFAEVFTSRVFLLAELTAAGKPLFRIPLPSSPNVRRYVRLNYIVVGTGTAGTFNSQLLFNRR